MRVTALRGGNWEAVVWEWGGEAVFGPGCYVLGEGDGWCGGEIGGEGRGGGGVVLEEGVAGDVGWSVAVFVLQPEGGLV